MSWTSKTSSLTRASPAASTMSLRLSIQWKNSSRAGGRRPARDGWTCRATTASRAPWERSASSRPTTCANGTRSPSPAMSWQWQSTRASHSTMPSRLYRRGTASTPHSATQQTPSCASASSRSCATVTATPTMRSMIVGSMSRPCPPPPSRSSPRKSRSRRVIASISWTQRRHPASTSRAAAPWSPWTAMITKS